MPPPQSPCPQGLQFEVKGGSRRWTFGYMLEGRQRELAIGKYPAMSLAEARAKRAELREAKDRGIDPKIAVAGTVPPTRIVTFRQDSEGFLVHMRGQWRAGHLKEWQQSVNRVAGALMDKATNGLAQEDVLSVIQPAWGTTNETARRVLGRIEQTIEHAIAIDPGRFTRPNPCVNVLRLLPRISPDVEPRAAMPWRDLPTFFSELHERSGQAARALEFLLLACCPRTGEIIPAAWREIDGDRWHVPAPNMKSGEARTILLWQV
jgi:Arm domain-containing DNA-binding protein/integrase-like protein